MESFQSLVSYLKETQAAKVSMVALRIKRCWIADYLVGFFSIYLVNSTVLPPPIGPTISNQVRRDLHSITRS